MLITLNIHSFFFFSFSFSTSARLVEDTAAGEATMGKSLSGSGSISRHPPPPLKGLPFSFHRRRLDLMTAAPQSGGDDSMTAGSR